VRERRELANDPEFEKRELANIYVSRGVDHGLARQVAEQAVSMGSLVFLAVLGMIGARAGGANIVKPTIRVTFWGALAMGVAAGIGAIFGTVG
jgi:VIT1/CCC1 family predicted Fe2+/Mn2+ transporter